jgi:hypothetical protein
MIYGARSLTVTVRRRMMGPGVEGENHLAGLLLLLLLMLHLLLLLLLMLMLVISIIQAGSDAGTRWSLS